MSETKRTSAGLPLHIGEDPNERAILMPDHLDMQAGWLMRVPKPQSPKMPVGDVYKAMRTTLAPFGIQAIRHGAKETKNMAEDEANKITRQITYPEGLINEAVNRHLSR